MGTIGLILRSLAEIAVVLSIIFGFLKENKVVRSEQKAFKFLRALRHRMKKARELELENELLQAEHAGEYQTDRRSSKPTEKSTGKKKKNSRVA